MSSMDSHSYRFQSAGNSAFVEATRTALQNVLASDRWDLRGEDSLTAPFLPATGVLKSLGGTGLIAQLWMARPSKGTGACKLELFSDLQPRDGGCSKVNREEIAGQIRRYLVRRVLRVGAIPSIRSTIVRCPFQVPRIVDVVSDTDENAALYPGEIERIVKFALYLDAELSDWVAKR